MQGDAKGYLVIIGGAEDKEGECVILRQAHEMLGDNGRLVVLTTASQEGVATGEEYRRVFERLGVKHIDVLDVNTRQEANDPAICDLLMRARCVFFTGGDQLRITSILGGTHCHRAIKAVYDNGGCIMGTSAGASVMSATMIVKGEDNEPSRKCTLKMAPGLDLFEGAIIDQHFDQRGRFGRLLTGVTENPGVLGIGIDEDTAVKLYPDGHFEVIGNNAVIIIDGSTIESSNVSELAQDELLAIVGATVHALPAGYGFDLNTRKVMRINNGHH
jgi:cyanophycinase